MEREASGLFGIIRNTIRNRIKKKKFFQLKVKNNIKTSNKQKSFVK
jgi:hypothetical protein